MGKRVDWAGAKQTGEFTYGHHFNVHRKLHTETF